MFCSTCGKEITKDSSFCKHCGANQSEIIVKKSKLVKNKTEGVWDCEYCGNEFKTKKISDNHELKCIKNPKNKKFPLVTNPGRAWFYLWIVTVLTFITTLLIITKYDEFNVHFFENINLLRLFLVNIGLGVFAFLAMIPTYNQKKNQVSSLTKNSLILCFIYLLVNPSIFAIEGNKAKYNEDYRMKYFVTATPIPQPNITTPILTPTPIIKAVKKTQPVTNSNNSNNSTQIDCIGPDGVQFKTTMEECKKLNETWGKPVDYLTNCEYPAECGGGTKYIKYSECIKPCKRIPTSSNTQNNNSSNKTAVYLTYRQYTIYCPSQNVGAVLSIDSTMKSKSEEWYKEHSECVDKSQDPNGCLSSCKLVFSSDSNQCAALYGYSGTEFDTCHKKAANHHLSCVNNCPVTAPQCDYIYFERNSLNSQIDSLCN